MTRKQIIGGLWEITHKYSSIDTVEMGSSLVEAVTKEEAFEFFNEEIADGRLIRKARSLDDVRPARAYIKK